MNEEILHTQKWDSTDNASYSHDETFLGLLCDLIAT